MGCLASPLRALATPTAAAASPASTISSHRTATAHGSAILARFHSASTGPRLDRAAASGHRFRVGAGLRVGRAMRWIVVVPLAALAACSWQGPPLAGYPGLQWKVVSYYDNRAMERNAACPL